MWGSLQPASGRAARAIMMNLGSRCHYHLALRLIAIPILGTVALEHDHVSRCSYIWCFPCVELPNTSESRLARSPPTPRNSLL